MSFGHVGTRPATLLHCQGPPMIAHSHQLRTQEGNEDVNNVDCQDNELSGSTGTTRYFTDHFGSPLGGLVDLGVAGSIWSGGRRGVGDVERCDGC